MVKKVIYSLSIVLSALLINACGGEGRKSSQISNIPAHEGKIKTNRVDWEDVNKPGESTLGILKKSLDNGLIEINLDKGSNVGEYIQFYIDSDYNEGTGYQSDWVNGADYLIEEGRIYKSTADGFRWNWEEIGEATFDKNDTTIYSKTTVDEILDLNPKFRVAAVSWNNEWESVSHIVMPPINRGVITIDGDASDWAHVAVLASSDIGELKVLDDDKAIYFLLQNGNVGQHTQIFLNIDNNINSGYGRNILDTKIGAEYLIEDDRLYRSTADGDSWSWEHVGNVIRSKNSNLIEIAVSKNDVEVNLGEGSINVGAVGWDATYANDVSHLSMHPTQFEGQKSLIISEVMAANAHINLDPDFLQFSDWVELHNQTENSIDLGNYKLSDKLSKGKWTIPEGTIIPANGYMLFWADGEDKIANGFHTNFKFKTSGEAAAIFDAQGILVDGFEFPEQKGDVSCAFVNNQVVYMQPTPNSANSNTVGSLMFSYNPSFSQEGGLFFDSETIYLSAQDASTIYYTTDGSFPTKQSTVYNGQIDIFETTVVRARAFEEGKLMSSAVTHTYFIGEYSTLPLVSISTDDKYLWDDTIGMYTIGTNGIESDRCEGVVANFMQDWKRPAHVEYFDENKNLGFSQEMEIKISGQCSRQRQQKSLALKVDSKYGKKMVSYKLFDDKDITEFKSFKLRNGGQDWYEAMIRDGLVQNVIKDDLNIDYQAYRPAIVFINGAYWGIHNIREKRNEDYLASNYPELNPRKVDILYREHEIKEGKSDDYVELLEYIENNSLSDAGNYQNVSKKIDIDNFIDYQISQIYSANFDWPYNNIRYWKERKDGAQWRWMMDDQDATFYLFKEFSADHNTLDLATSYNTYGERNPEWSTFMLRSLLENETFKAEFVNKFRAYLSTTFEPTRVKSIINDMTNTIRPEMQRHINRWRGDGPNDPLTEDMGDWNMFVNRILDFADRRAAVISGQLDDKFGN